MVVATDAENPTTQPTTRSTIRETETEDQSNVKLLMVLASRPDRTGNDVNACTCRTIVFASGPEDRDEWTHTTVKMRCRRHHQSKRPVSF